jgi:hypothetical protein
VQSFDLCAHHITSKLLYETKCVNRYKLIQVITTFKKKERKGNLFNLRFIKMIFHVT